MASKVNAVLLKRLTRLEAPIGDSRRNESWPKIMEAHEWEAIAVPQQEALRLDTRRITPSQLT